MVSLCRTGSMGVGRDSKGEKQGERRELNHDAASIFGMKRKWVPALQVLSRSTATKKNVLDACRGVCVGVG